MPAVATDILHVESEDAGSSGGAIAAGPVPIISGVANNVWPNIDSVERLAGGTRPRKTFFLNTHATLEFPVPVLYTPVLPSNAALVVGLGINHAVDDNVLQGNMTAWGAAARPTFISDGADVRVVSCLGLNNAGTPVPILETIALNGAAEVQVASSFTKVWAWWVASASGTRTVLCKQGSGGTTRGTIGPNEIVSWLWVTAGPTIGAGLQLPDLAAGQSYGVWRRLTWIAGAAVTRPNSLTVKLEEAS